MGNFRACIDRMGNNRIFAHSFRIISIMDITMIIDSISIIDIMISISSTSIIDSMIDIMISIPQHFATSLRVVHPRKSCTSLIHDQLTSAVPHSRP
jgi:hypothetical protein